MSNNQVHFISLGCPRNLVDSEVMLGILLKAGYEVTESLERADYLVVNTCGFLDSSREESKEAIREVLAHKKPSAKLIVTGCMVSKHRAEIEETFPGVHYLLGSGDVEGILNAVHSDTQGQQISSARSYLEAGEVPRMLSTPSHFAYLKIAEGCRKACAYCIIPKIKGPLKSKTTTQILREFHSLLAQGVKEIILIAQDLGDFGKDQDQTALLPLLKEILKIPGDYWLRMLYLYPDEINDELITLMCKESRLLPYLDMPIQHINDTLLKAMRRTTTSSQIKEVITKLRQKVPDVHIRTSLIVGFPGETEEQFEELTTFLEAFPLNHVGIFKYSQEAETAAGKMKNQVPEKTKISRHKRLAAVQHRVAAKLNQTMVGRRFVVVIEGYHPESSLLLVGRYFGQCPEIDGQVILNDWQKVDAFGERYWVEITAVAGYDLVGTVIEKITTSSNRRPSLTLARN
jgi:ribosomal protein S12 methylthiotransferase